MMLQWASPGCGRDCARGRAIASCGQSVSCEVKGFRSSVREPQQTEIIPLYYAAQLVGVAEKVENLGCGTHCEGTEGVSGVVWF